VSVTCRFRDAAIAVDAHIAVASCMLLHARLGRLGARDATVPVGRILRSADSFVRGSAHPRRTADAQPAFACAMYSASNSRMPFDADGSASRVHNDQYLTPGEETRQAVRMIRVTPSARRGLTLRSSDTASCFAKGQIPPRVRHVTASPTAPAKPVRTTARIV